MSIPAKNIPSFLSHGFNFLQINLSLVVKIVFFAVPPRLRLALISFFYGTLFIIPTGFPLKRMTRLSPSLICGIYF